jgi:hypothetical protein
MFLVIVNPISFIFLFRVHILLIEKDDIGSSSRLYCCCCDSGDV